MKLFRVPGATAFACLMVAAGAETWAQTNDTPLAGYTRCAVEGGSCAFNGAANVVYGARSQWTAPRRVTGGVACTNAVFGDPLYGVVKACYSQAVAVSQQLQQQQPASAPIPPAPIPTPPPPPPVSESLRLAWIAPLANADGSSLTDLAGYRVKLGTQSGQYTRIIPVDGPHNLSATVTSLAVGTYYVAVTAVDTAGNESAPSAEVVKVLR